MPTFSQGFGRWAGTAEVFSGEGRFLGNGADQRQVQDLGGGRTRIDVAFVGPFKHAGYYEIQSAADHRLYLGPANVGYAETLSPSLVDAHAYWAALGLSQRFFLMVLPDGQTQLSLALMSRGEQLVYAVVGQNDRVPEGAASPPPSLVSGTSYDLAADPTAGRGAVLLHRAGQWVGELEALDGERRPAGRVPYKETVRPTGEGLAVTITGGFARRPRRMTVRTNGWQAWTAPGATVGSYSLSGGRALSGDFHYLDQTLRIWRREVVRHDGAQKAVVHVAYRGGQRVGVQFGVLAFKARR